MHELDSLYYQKNVVEKNWSTFTAPDSDDRYEKNKRHTSF